MTPKRRARIYRGTPRNLRLLANVLRNGGIVGVPTETVYGLAGDALNAAACRKIFKAKARPTNDPLIVHVAKWSDVSSVAEVNDAARLLARRFWPGPLTMVLPKRSAIPEIVSAGLPSVAVRMPRHSLFRRLITLTGRPLAAPSANPFGYVSPTSAAHVHASLGSKIDHILDGGQAQIGVESTIVDLRDPTRPRLLRPGAVTKQQLEATLGRRVSMAHDERQTRAQLAPGRLSRHYSPRTPATLHPHLSTETASHGAKDEAWIFASRPAKLRGRNIFWLETGGSLKGAARHLFSVLRQVDQGGFSRIHLERVRGGGLADAINDRLQRAASKT